MIPKVVVIGGREVGKTSTIQMTWADEIQEFEMGSNGEGFYNVVEMIPGREIMEYEIIELPRIRYTYDDSSNPSEIITSHLSNADVILILCPVNDLAINSHASYLMTLFNCVKLKRNVIILVGLTKSDIIITPNAAKDNRVDINEKVEFSYISSMISKVATTHCAFSNLVKFDKTFSSESIIPFSNAIQWNFDNLKYNIWNGIVLGMNEYVYDKNLPTVVLSGKTGCGKTSTINTLWNKKLAVDRAVSCTKFPAVMRISDIFNGKRIYFNLVDLPGIAESVEANSVYKNFYSNYISRANVLICLTQADRRAYKQDELFYKELIANNILCQNQNIILGINQADLLFKTENTPSGIDLNAIANDDTIINEKIGDLYNGIFKDIFSDFGKVTIDSVVIYSVLKNWRVEDLKKKIYSFL